jgi:hypothetical protein
MYHIHNCILVHTGTYQYVPKTLISYDLSGFQVAYMPQIYTGIVTMGGWERVGWIDSESHGLQQ